ncbi:MAG: phage adaptor protein [Thermoanaerobaculia bacterium]
MNLSELQSALMMRAGNLSSNDPAWVAANDGRDFINQAQDFMVLRTLLPERRRLNLFNSLRDRWHVKTQANVAWLDIPERCLTIDSVYTYDDSGTEPDEGLARRRRVEFVDEDTYETAPRDYGIRDYPKSCVRMGERLYVHPTPDSEHVSWLLVKGLKLCSPLENPTDVSVVGRRWDVALEDAATHLMFKRFGWTEEAAKALSDLDSSITRTIDVIGAGRTKHPVRLRVKGLPLGR